MIRHLLADAAFASSPLVFEAVPEPGSRESGLPVPFESTTGLLRVPGPVVLPFESQCLGMWALAVLVTSLSRTLNRGGHAKLKADSRESANSLALVGRTLPDSSKEPPKSTCPVHVKAQGRFATGTRQSRGFRVFATDRPRRRRIRGGPWRGTKPRRASGCGRRQRRTWQRTRRWRKALGPRSFIREALGR